MINLTALLSVLSVCRFKEVARIFEPTDPSLHSRLANVNRKLGWRTVMKKGRRRRDGGAVTTFHRRKEIKPNDRVGEGALLNEKFMLWRCHRGADYADGNRDSFSNYIPRRMDVTLPVFTCIAGHTNTTNNNNTYRTRERVTWLNGL